MPKYIIERNIPGAGSFTAEQLTAIAQKSCGVLDTLGSQIQWVHSYVTSDRITCIYIAPNQAIVYEAARLCGFPADSVQEIRTTIDPTTAENQISVTIRSDLASTRLLGRSEVVTAEGTRPQ